VKVSAPAFQLQAPDALGLAASQALEAWKERTRGSIHGFIEGIAKDEKGNPTQQSTIHRVMHLHFEYCWSVGVFPAILAPFNHGKTVQLVVNRIAYELGHDQTLRCKIVSNTDPRALERAMGVKQLIFSPAYRLAFPGVRLATPEQVRKLGRAAKVTQHAMYLDRPGMAIDPSVHAVGVTTSGTGGRADLLLFDDVVDQNNAIDKPELRTKIISQFENVWIQRLEPGGRAGYLGTAWHQADLTHTLMDRPGWCLLSMAISEDFERIDMQVYNPPAGYPLPRLDRERHGAPSKTVLPQWVEVSSSNIEGVRWANGVLEVRFRGGGHYRYEGVPKDVFNDLVQAASPGGFFGQWIKNAYPTQKVA